MSDNFKIFSKKWNYDKMMSWNKPMEHTGTNCGELAISYLGLTSSDVCIRDSYYNIKRGNYGRSTDEITKFISANSSTFRVDTEEYNLNICDFLENDGRLAKLIGNNRETMVLITNHKQKIGHYVILCVINDKSIVKDDDFKIHLIDPSLSKYYSGSELVNYLKENHFYSAKKGLNLFFLEIRGKKRVRNASPRSAPSAAPQTTAVLVPTKTKSKSKSPESKVKSKTSLSKVVYKIKSKLSSKKPLKTTQSKIMNNRKATKKTKAITSRVEKKKKLQTLINQFEGIKL